MGHRSLPSIHHKNQHYKIRPFWALQLVANTKIEATFPGAYKSVILLGASLPSSFLSPRLP
jgi:hypothetical protein